MPRTTSTAVQGIIETDVTISLTPFIEVASNLVDQVCLDSGYSDTTLELIERWLAAHFYAVRDARRDTEKLGQAMDKYQYKVDLGLKVTVYGQQVMFIDTAGNLAALQAQAESGQARRAGVVWLGEENLGYEESVE
jgi:hypothetical protein